MRILIRLIGILGLLSVIFYFFSQKKYSTKIENETNRHKDLTTKLTGVPVINEDFNFFDSLIKDKRIILLGEQTHGDGASQKLKTELILYLNGKGYDVVIFESPLYKTEQNWNTLEKEGKADFSESLYKFWSNAKENQRLFDLITNKVHSKSPLYLSGVDYQFPLRFSQPKIAKELKEYFKGFDTFDKGEYNLLWECFENRLGPILYLNNSPNSSATREKLPILLNQIHKLESLIDNKDTHTRNDLFMKRELNNLRNFFYSKANLNDAAQSHFRDSLMYENAKWLIDTIYPNKKIIIWAANAHIINDWATRTMGTYLKRYFKDEVYTILFTSYRGTTRNISNEQIQRVPPRIKSSTEYFLAEKYPKIAYFRPSENLQDSTSVMRFLGYRNIKDKWFRKLDGFFFINNMYPITFTNGNL